MPESTDRAEHSAVHAWTPAPAAGRPRTAGRE